MDGTGTSKDEMLWEGENGEVRPEREGHAIQWRIEIMAGGEQCRSSAVFNWKTKSGVVSGQSIGDLRWSDKPDRQAVVTFMARQRYRRFSPEFCLAACGWPCAAFVVGVTSATRGSLPPRSSRSFLLIVAPDQPRRRAEDVPLAKGVEARETNLLITRSLFE